MLTRWYARSVTVKRCAACSPFSRRRVIEGVIVYTLGRLGALITPAFFPDWLYVALPLLFLALQYLIAPVWATRRIQSTRRERLSKRFWLLGPLLASICFSIDLLVTLTMGLALNMGEVQQGPALWRLFAGGAHHLGITGLAVYELKTVSLLLAISSWVNPAAWRASTSCSQSSFLAASSL